MHTTHVAAGQTAAKHSKAQDRRGGQGEADPLARFVLARLSGHECKSSRAPWNIRIRGWKTQAIYP